VIDAVSAMEIRAKLFRSGVMAGVGHDEGAWARAKFAIRRGGLVGSGRRAIINADDDYHTAAHWDAFTQEVITQKRELESLRAALDESAHALQRQQQRADALDQALHAPPSATSQIETLMRSREQWASRCRGRLSSHPRRS